MQEARQLESIFLNSSLGQPLELVREFSAVWKRVALDPQLLEQERSAVRRLFSVAGIQGLLCGEQAGGGGSNLCGKCQTEARCNFYLLLVLPAGVLL